MTYKECIGKNHWIAYVRINTDMDFYFETPYGLITYRKEIVFRELSREELVDAVQSFLANLEPIHINHDYQWENYRDVVIKDCMETIACRDFAYGGGNQTLDIVFIEANKRLKGHELRG